MKLNNLIKKLEQCMNKKGDFFCSIDDYAPEIYTYLKEYSNEKRKNNKL